MKLLTIGRSGQLNIAVIVLFASKLVVGMALLAASARWLSVSQFATFSQLLILLAFLVTITTGGVQHGLIRQVAAATNQAMIRVTLKGALAIWAAVAALTLAVCFFARDFISSALVGTPTVAWSIPVVALLASLSGLGQLFVSVLTGDGRPVTSMLLQCLGLAVSITALAPLMAGQPVIAALVFAAGPMLTTAGGLFFMIPIMKGRGDTRNLVFTESRRLLKYSAAFLTTAAFMPLTLIGLRGVYNAAFGLDALGLWLAANRISDVSTQVVGLYMAQVYLPAMTKASGRAETFRLVRLAFLRASGAAFLGLLVFLVAPGALVTLFLSEKFVPAIPWIIVYFLGDGLRVASSIISFTFLAKGRLGGYVALELGTAALMAILVLSMIGLRVEAAGPISYAVTYAAIWIGAVGFVWWLFVRGGPKAG